jgi:hypothetical protein
MTPITGKEKGGDGSNVEVLILRNADNHRDVWASSQSRVATIMTDRQGIVLVGAYLDNAISGKFRGARTAWRTVIPDASVLVNARAIFMALRLLDHTL